MMTLMDYLILMNNDMNVIHLFTAMKNERNKCIIISNSILEKIYYYRFCSLTMNDTFYLA